MCVSHFEYSAHASVRYCWGYNSEGELGICSLYPTSWALPLPVSNTTRSNLAVNLSLATHVDALRWNFNAHLLPSFLLLLLLPPNALALRSASATKCWLFSLHSLLRYFQREGVLVVSSATVQCLAAQTQVQNIDAANVQIIISIRQLRCPKIFTYLSL